MVKMAHGERLASSTRGQHLMYNNIQNKDADQLTDEALAKLHNKPAILRGATSKKHGDKSDYNTTRGQSIFWTPEDEEEHKVKAFVRDTAGLLASQKWEDLVGKGVTHLVIQDDENALKKIPVEVCNIQTLRSFTLRWSKIKFIPDHFIGLKLKKLCLRKCPLKNVDTICFMRTLITLELVDDGLKKIPMEIGEMTSLVNLDLTGNNLSSLPISIGNLHRLQVIKICGNSISEIPTSITELTKLITLDFSQNHIKNIPKDIGNLSQLITVRLSHNQLTALPSSFNQLCKLKHLYLGYNRFMEVPKLLEKLPELQTLNMVSNRVSNIPCPMLNLTTLLLDKNELKELSEPLFLSSNLEKLAVQYNKIEVIPPLIARLEKLRALYIGGNSIKRLPDDICMLSNLRHLVVRESKIQDLPTNFDKLQRLSVIDIEETEMDAMYLYALKTDGIEGLLEQVRIKRETSGTGRHTSSDDVGSDRGSSIFDTEDEAASEDDLLDDENADSDSGINSILRKTSVISSSLYEKKRKTMDCVLLDDNPHASSIKRETGFSRHYIPSLYPPVDDDDPDETTTTLPSEAMAFQPHEMVTLTNGRPSAELEVMASTEGAPDSTTTNRKETSFIEPDDKKPATVRQTQMASQKSQMHSKDAQRPGSGYKPPVPAKPSLK